MRISIAKIVNNIYSPKTIHLLLRAKKQARKQSKHGESRIKTHIKTFTKHIQFVCKVYIDNF